MYVWQAWKISLKAVRKSISMAVGSFLCFVLSTGFPHVELNTPTLKAGKKDWPSVAESSFPVIRFFSLPEKNWLCSSTAWLQLRDDFGNNSTRFFFSTAWVRWLDSKARQFKHFPPHRPPISAYFQIVALPQDVVETSFSYMMDGWYPSSPL